MKFLVQRFLYVALILCSFVTISCDRPNFADFSDFRFNLRKPYPVPTKAKDLNDLPSDSANLGMTCTDRQNSPTTANRPIVVMVSLDGFRADYMQKINPPNLKKIAKAGIYTPGLIPSYPSHTYPNHFTLVTGRRPANHGILSNKFYDKVRNETYDAFGDSSSDGSWYQGDPLWNVVEKNGMIAHTFHWVGSEVHVNGQDPTCYAAYSGKVTTGQRVDTAIQWLKLPAEKRPHYINIYTPDIDIAGHAHGPDSSEIKETVLAVDREMGRLWDFIRTSDLPINIVIVSDHGMQTNYQDKIIFLGGMTDLTGFKWGDKGAAVMLYHESPARINQVYQDLKAKEKNFKVYLKHEIPAQYHMTNPDRTGDILVVSEPGHYITDRTFNPDKPYRVGGGSHGWPTHNKEMHALFIAAGDNIGKRATVIPEFSNVDVYPFVMDLLSITTDIPHDGNPLTLRRYILAN